jgi:hypothetical protein
MIAVGVRNYRIFIKQPKEVVISQSSTPVLLLVKFLTVAAQQRINTNETLVLH